MERYISIYLISCFYFFLLFRIERYIEYKHVKEALPILHIQAKWTLLFFKIARFLIALLGSFEVVCRGKFELIYICVGIAMLFLGVGLRVSAIKELGHMWCYHSACLAGQKRTKTGIYKYLKHPAYIGNIYITGLLLIIGATYSAMISLVFIFLFYIIRAHYEETILKEIRA